MTDIEIPYPEDRHGWYRVWEILPGFLSWSLLLSPIYLTLISPSLTAVLILVYLLSWFVKGMALNVRVLQGWNMMQRQMKLPWENLLDDVEASALTHPHMNYPKWHVRNIARTDKWPFFCKPSEVYHLIIIARWNEGRDTLEPTIKSVIASKYDLKNVILLLAYEERAGDEIAKDSKALINEYKHEFLYAEAIGHPDGVPGEQIGKGSNISHAARAILKYLESKHINPERVPVTTLDSDNRPHPYYLSALTYTYCSTEDPRYVSYQPIPLFLNNIWDAPSPMRVIAAGNSFFNIMLSLRQHALRNFSSHAQSLAALKDTDFWSVRTVVEDGHQFWRTYFRYNSRHEVFPIFLPVYQDAVLAATYKRTLKMQFYQLRRWAYGASDIAYVASKGFRKGNGIPKHKVLAKFGRLLEGHVSWATASLLIAIAPLIPVFIRNKNFVAIQLPSLAKNITTIALVGIFISLFVSLKSLPPKPERYKRHRTIFMILQWALLPITTLVYNTMAALNSQTRLMFKRYLGKFDLTEKAVRKD